MAGLAGLLAVGLAGLTGCGGGSGEGVLPTAEYMPLQTGNQWVYQVVDHAPELASASVARRALTRRPRSLGTAQTMADDVVTVLGTTWLGADEWFEVSAAFVGGDPVYHYLRHTAQGLWWKKGMSDPGYYHLYNPLVVGTTWEVADDLSITLRILVTNATMSTEAGTFRNCLVVEDRQTIEGEPDDVITSWYAPGVGLVRTEEHLGSELMYETALKSYSLASQGAQ